LHAGNQQAALAGHRQRLLIFHPDALNQIAASIIEDCHMQVSKTV
jgi:hypothetical protein